MQTAFLPNHHHNEVPTPYEVPTSWRNQSKSVQSHCNKKTEYAKPNISPDKNSP